MKANGHFVFEEIGEFVNALDIYHILAAYKFFSEQNLTFQEMRVEPFASAASVHANGQLVLSNLRSNGKLNLRFFSNENFVLVYAVEGMM